MQTQKTNGAAQAFAPVAPPISAVKGVSLRDMLKSANPAMSDDQITALIAEGAQALKPGALTTLANASRPASRFSKSTTREKKPAFDPMAYYSLRNVAKIGEAENGADVLLGFVQHPADAKDDSGKLKSRYNGNVVITGLTPGRAIVMTPATLDLFSNMAATIQAYLARNEAALRAAMESAT